MINIDMAILKTPNIGVYESKTRALQRRLSFESVSLSWKTVNVYKYLGSAVNGSPTIYDIQDKVFLENPDRSYDQSPVEINAWYEMLPESQFDLSKFGIINPIGNTQQFKFHINSFAGDGLGRYIVVGDILEVPFLLQDKNKAFFEVTDIDRKTEFENFFVIVTTTPISDTQETDEITDMNSNSDLMDELGIDIGTEQDGVFADEGLDPYRDTDTDYADVDAVAPDDAADTRDPYDVPTDDMNDFLDNPDKEVY